MNKELENQFFKAYKHGGIIYNCLKIIMGEYNWETIRNDKDDVAVKHGWEPKLCDKQSVDAYVKTLREKVDNQVKDFDYNILECIDSPLINEIKDNFEECETLKQKERYIYTLLTPFALYSDVLYPYRAPTDRMAKKINSLKIENRKLKKKYSKTEKSNEVKEAKLHIENLELREIIRLELIDDCFCEYAPHSNNHICLIFKQFRKLTNIYANQLYAICLMNSIDFYELQKICSIYLIQCNLKDVAFYIGSIELAQLYADELHQIKSSKSLQSKNDTISLDRDRLLLYFKSSWRRHKELQATNADRLLEDIRAVILRNDPKIKLQITAIASIIRESRYFSSKEDIKTFSKWLKIFMEICGISFSDYTKSKAKNYIPELKKTLYYLDLPIF